MFKNPCFFKYRCRLDSLFYQCIHFRFYISQFFKSLEFLGTFYYNHYLQIGFLS